MSASNLEHSDITAAGDSTGGLRPEPKPPLMCDFCGEGIYEFEGYFEICGGVICDCCIDRFRRVAIEEA